jgi:hypothetical protein
VRPRLAAGDARLELVEARHRAQEGADEARVVAGRRAVVGLKGLGHRAAGRWEQAGVVEQMLDGRSQQRGHR